ncbi:uncharacterized protein PHACADRAFT_263219 [Phanerochaete carnosa HHB-10118-sp]|uniref:Uncharacterized protein n=1 Tax=Phanerochaete carnosa (strain HHB-10118-sp) TaxID=650164 RepID=K5VWL3_PHACS|nr:uncharacterized protein PHACADRAFT_263219 [Phanerochaete carnosa HHB-10118-sp]EKM51200.1 hypothetical protein PHACADRAFT_263219 [Phanerochaete carnosa HHB-10118-sp]
MGGFTRPQDLRVSNWWPGGAYLRKRKVYEAPPPAAYEPHTAFLLEARYPTRHGVGRQDSIEHVVGVCREGDLPAILEKYNSWNCPKEEMEVMDNAIWPWVEKRSKKSVVWWDKGESRREVLERRQQEIYEGASSADATTQPVVSMDLTFAPVPPPKGQRQKRAFHSAVAWRSDVEKTHTTPAERAEMPASAWSRPHKPSQDADDNVVPTYYVERKRQLDDIAERKETEGNLMSQLSAGILSEGITAETHPREEKIPPEVIEEDGTVRFPSGFEPPTPATEFHPVAALPVFDTDDNVVKSGKIIWEEALTPPETEELAACGASSVHGMSGVRGFHTSAVARAREVPLHGMASHAVPPQSPAQASKDSVPAESKQQLFALPEKIGEDGDEYFLEADEVVEAGGPVLPVADSVRDFNSKLHEYRERYVATLKEEPYWRPMLTATLSTRSLALTYARMCRALPRGLPFYASIEEPDRKYAPTYNSRMHSLRVRRMRQVIVDIGRRLHGDFGGFPGIRFSPSDRGRTLEGEGLEAPIPLEKRLIHVGVGDWHRNGEQLREVLKEEVDELGLSDGFNIFGLDKWGKRSDGVEWARPQAPIASKALSKVIDVDLAKLSPRERKLKLQEITEREGRKIAYALSQKSRKVSYPAGHEQASMDDFDEVIVPPSATKPESSQA